MLRKLKSDKIQLAPIQEELDPSHIYEMINHHICSLEKKPEKTAVEMVPPQYHVYLDIFEKKASECMPLHKPWDHAIDLVLDFKTIKSHIYPYSPTEQAEIDAFIDDQLAKAISVPLHQIKLWECSLSPRRMEKSKWYRIIIISILKPLRTITHSL